MLLGKDRAGKRGAAQRVPALRGGAPALVSLLHLALAVGASAQLAGDVEVVMPASEHNGSQCMHRTIVSSEGVARAVGRPAQEVRQCGSAGGAPHLASLEEFKLTNGRRSPLSGAWARCMSFIRPVAGWAAV